MRVCHPTFFFVSLTNCLTQFRVALAALQRGFCIKKQTNGIYIGNRDRALDLGRARGDRLDLTVTHFRVSTAPKCSVRQEIGQLFIARYVDEGKTSKLTSPKR